MADPEQGIKELLITRLFKERIEIIVLAIMLSFVCWFCYSLVQNVIQITEKVTIVIERNNAVILEYKTETTGRMTDDHRQIIDLLKDIKADLKK